MKRTGVFARIGVVGAGAVIAGAALAMPASAQSATANLTVSATVTVNCTISTSPVAFGNYDPVVANASAALDATGTITVACTKGATSSIGLNLGSNGSGSTRRMSSGGGNYLAYELYSNAARTTVWENSGAGLLSTGVSPSKAARTFTVYGRVAGNQDVSAGGYTDTVVATVNF